MIYGPNFLWLPAAASPFPRFFCVHKLSRNLVEFCKILLFESNLNDKDLWLQFKKPNHFLYYDSAKYHENDLNNRGIRIEAKRGRKSLYLIPLLCRWANRTTLPWASSSWTSAPSPTSRPSKTRSGLCNAVCPRRLDHRYKVSSLWKLDHNFLDIW